MTRERIGKDVTQHLVMTKRSYPDADYVRGLRIVVPTSSARSSTLIVVISQRTALLDSLAGPRPHSALRRNDSDLAAPTFQHTGAASR